MNPANIERFAYVAVDYLHGKIEAICLNFIGGNKL
jgi:hypothetical protein